MNPLFSVSFTVILGPLEVHYACSIFKIKILFFGFCLLTVIKCAHDNPAYHYIVYQARLNLMSFLANYWFNVREIFLLSVVPISCVALVKFQH